MDQNEFSQNINQFKKDFKKQMRYFVLIVLGIAGFVGVTSCYYTVEPDEEAVVIRLGKYLGTYPPGLHFKLPFGIDKKVIVKTKLIQTAEFGFRSSRSSSRLNSYSSGAKKNYDNESKMLTGDLNVAIVQWVVLYQISDPFKYIFQSARPKRNIKDVSESILRRVVGDMLVSDVLTIGRAMIAQQAKDLMQEVLDKYDIGVTIRGVKLQDVNPPNSVRASFNEVNMAKQEQEKVINQAEKEYNKVIPEARGKALEMISNAEGFATATVNRAIGDSKKFTSILAEYKKSPNITKRRLFLETMENIFSNVEKLTVVDSKVKGVLPVFGSNGKGIFPQAAGK